MVGGQGWVRSQPKLSHLEKADACQGLSSLWEWGLLRSQAGKDGEFSQREGGIGAAIQR